MFYYFCIWKPVSPLWACGFSRRVLQTRHKPQDILERNVWCHEERNPWMTKDFRKGRLRTFIFCYRNLVNFTYYKKIAQLTSAWVILSQVAHVNAIRISCAYGYWRVSVLLHNSLPTWANWLLVSGYGLPEPEVGISKSTATHVFFINLN